MSSLIPTGGSSVLTRPWRDGWAYEPNALCGTAFAELLTVGGRILYETHFGPLLGMGSDRTVSPWTSLPPTGPVADVSHRERHGSTDGDPSCCRSPSWTPPTAVPTSRTAAGAPTAQTEQERVRVFAETLRRALLPPLLSPPDGLEAADYYFTALPTMSAAISTTCFRCPARRGASSSATSRERASRPPW